MTLNEKLRQTQHGLELMELELNRLNNVLGLLFVIVVVMMFVMLLLLIFNSYLVTELGDLQSQLAEQNARVTALTAEVRGVGG